ncbi:MAG: S1C family serine protease, partial [Myxococcota bacterium]
QVGVLTAPGAVGTTPGGPTPLVHPPSPKALVEDERNTIDVFRAAAPATVFVTQTQVVVDYWNRRTMEVPAGSGTGFLWDANGHVVTNYHVVANGRSYTVTLYDQSEWPAKLVGGDPRKDVAVLKIEAPKDRLVSIRLPPDGYDLEVGQKAIAIGNPFGLDHTLTTGVISAMDREIVGYGNVTIRGMVQTDASINPGNSGGPLLDSAGQLIGMNTMIFSQSGASAGIGFAVPVETVRRVVDQVIETGRVEQVGIGVQVLDDQTAQRIGVRGVVIREVVADSPAARAGLRGITRTRTGLRLGDVIVRVDDEAIESFDDLYNALDRRKAGETVTVGVLRDGQEQRVEIPLVVVNDGG